MPACPTSLIVPRFVVRHAAAVGFAVLLALLALVTLAPPALAQGALTPPAGAPAATQRSLQQVWEKLADLDTSTRTLANEVATQRLTLQQLVGLTTEVQLPWQVTTLATAAPDPLFPAREPELVVSRQGRVFISYLSNRTVGLLEGDGTRWTASSVPGSAWSTGLAVGPDGEPALLVAEMGATLRLKRRTAGVWTSTLVASGLYLIDGFGWQPKLVVTPQGEWVASYLVFANSRAELELARSPDGVTWTRTRPDTVAVGVHSLALAPDGRTAVAYTRSGSVALREWDGSAWAEQFTLQSYFVDLTFRRDGAPAFVLDGPDNAFNYAERLAGQNTFSPVVIPGIGLVGHVRLAPDGAPGVVTHAWDGGRITYSRRVGGVWQSTFVASAPRTDGGTAFAYGPDFQPMIVFLAGLEVRLARPDLFLPATPGS